MTKQDLRIHFKNVRDFKDSAAAKKADFAIIKKLVEASQNHQTIFCYVSFGSEIETHNYIKQMLDCGKTVCVPKIRNGEMHAIKITNLADLIPNKMGILQPKFNATKIVNNSEIDLAVVPMLAFDENNYRIGYGGGYYDKFLAETTCFKVGLAYSFLKTEEAFNEAHDIKLDKIITEKLGREIINYPPMSI